MKRRIRGYFEKVIADPVKDDDDIFVLGVVDSLFAMQLVTYVETEFDFTVERDDLDIRHFSSIAALAAFVETKLAAKEAGHGHPAD